MSKLVQRGCVVGVLAWLTLGVGCAAFPELKTLGPTLDKAFPARHGIKLATIEPFTVVRVLDRGLTYLEISPPGSTPGSTPGNVPGNQSGRASADSGGGSGGGGALMSVNEGPWTTSAVVRRGDRVDVAYPNLRSGKPMAGSLSYTIYGPTTKGYIRLAETRWFYDGYPEERRSLRVLPYEVRRQTAAAVR